MPGLPLFRWLLAGSLLGCLCLPAHAAPLLLAAQGKLVDETGLGLEGDYYVRFSLYGDADAATPALWNEFINVEFEQGQYATVLGRVNPIGAAVLDEAEVYLGVSLDLANELLPRPQLMAVPYATLSEASRNQSGGTVEAGHVFTDNLSAGELTADSVQAVTVEGAAELGALDVGPVALNGNGIGVGDEILLGADGRFVDNAPLPPELLCEEGRVMRWQSGAWRCASEQDATFSGSAAATISIDQTVDWSEASGAFDWGDHSEGSYLSTEIDPEFGSSMLAGLDDSDVGHWDAVKFWVQDQSFVSTTALGGISEPLSASDVAGWTAAYDLLGSQGANYGGRDWGKAYSFAAGFEEYADGAAPAQGVSSADLADWRALLDCAHLQDPPCEPDPAAASSWLDLSSPPYPDFNFPDIPPLNATAVALWNESSLYVYQDPVRTCRQALERYPASVDGKYWLLNPATGLMEELWCDMSGGGWTRLQSSDFEKTTDGFSNGSIQNWNDSLCFPAGLGEFYGYFAPTNSPLFANPKAVRVFDLTDRPHSEVRFELDFMAFGAWYRGDDRGVVEFNGVQVHTTPDFVDSTHANSYCFMGDYINRSMYPKVRMAVDSVSHTSDVLEFAVTSTLKDWTFYGGAPGYWAIDNVEIWIR